MATHRFLTGFVALAAVTTFLHCSNKSAKQSAGGSTCTATQALQVTGLRGTSMAPKSIALTFDDGPGPRTKALSRYLKDEGIEAAFFVNGRSMDAGAAEVLQALIDDGHLVSNHTESHQSLTGTATGTARLADLEVVQELTETDTKIDPFVPTKRFLFRPPFGDYDDITFAALADTPMNKYVGPIMWDVGDKMDEAAGRVADWDCWQDGTDGKRTPMKTCGDLYITEIKRANRGIVLLHDPYYNDQDPEQQGTVDMVMYMVPLLKAEGFTFTRVDKVPEIDALLPPLPAAENPGGGDPGTAPGPGDEVPGAAGDDPCP
ncbi:MAG: polysaccharide deacetylase family protein [Labilithrix sp.]|nr:polysaccharide deacetylase family protein [Labilithrix sp.]